ncbi:MAG: SCO family protein [Henriciella sp.]|nr:SCO family protein [Henriciella sp.]
MTQVNRRAALAGIAALAATPLRAHSVADLEQEFGGKEPYFQALDKAAPDFTLSDPFGRLLRPADFAGKVVILHFVYTRCPDICPLHTEKLADVQARINQTPMKDRVQFVTITSDPENDTPEVLRDYGVTHGMDPANWTFLTIAPGQPPETTRDLARAFGHKFTVEEDGTQTHGIITHIVGKTGRWRGNFHGLEFDPLNMVLFVNALVNDYDTPHGAATRGLWDRLTGMFR